VIQTLLSICVAKHSTGILIVLLVFSDVGFSRLMESEYSPAQLGSVACKIERGRN
jgi:hypothetical protein